MEMISATNMDSSGRGGIGGGYNTKERIIALPSVRIPNY